jgi:Tfp pilus assembly protein PilO
MNKFISKHKRLLIIVLIALIIIGIAYYFTLGKDLFQNKDTSEGADSGSGSNSNSTPSN